jgi:D-glycero-D-manno-heptose 1,7-bisphosphate phosphatase
MHKALFLDRDGVINHDPGDYTCSPDEFIFNPGIFEFLQDMQKRGYRLVIVTNQGGIAKGLYSLATFAAINEKMLAGFAVHGIEVDEVYFCRHHPDFGLCLCRKPGSLFIEKALARFGYDASTCFMIGDRERDVAAAEGAGVKGYLVTQNSLLKSTDFPDL